MRPICLSVLFSVAMVTTALAVGAGWHGPGWYVVMNTPVKQSAIYRGAYKTKDDCMAEKPADHGAVEYDCIEFDHEPLDQ